VLVNLGVLELVAWDPSSGRLCGAAVPGVDHCDDNQDDRERDQDASDHDRKQR
jgi:hypothetical protein